MISDEFELQYWRAYITLEKEFFESEPYVDFSQDNFSTFSSNYGKLLLQIGSEVDISCKYFCRLLGDNSARSIGRYGIDIRKAYPDFTNVGVRVLNRNFSIFPWKNWTNKNAPDWWAIYNNYKHGRLEICKIKGHENVPNYKLANLQNVMNGLAGLYQIELYCFYHISITEPSIPYKLPLPGSRLFNLFGKGTPWDDTTFARDIAFLDTEDGPIYVIGNFQY